MRILLPHTSEFRDFPQRDWPRPVEFTFFSPGRVPEGPADGAVMLRTDEATTREILGKEGMKWALVLLAGIDGVLPLMPPGVALYNTSRLHNEAVAVHTLAGMLAAARALPRFRDSQNRGRWERNTAGLRTLRGAKVVIWGYGMIGQRLHELLEPHGAEVSGIRSSTPPAERDRLLAGADWVVLLLPSTPETRWMMDRAMLSRIRRGAWLLSVGRGDVMKADDLIWALDAGQLGGAFLDVTDPEPLPDDHPLWSHPNVIVTPHLASATDDVGERGAELSREFIIDMLEGREPPGRVEVGKGY